jgi:hypothetical protein
VASVRAETGFRRAHARAVVAHPQNEFLFVNLELGRCLGAVRVPGNIVDAFLKNENHLSAHIGAKLEICAGRGFSESIPGLHDVSLMNALYLISLAVALVSCWARHVSTLAPHRLEVPPHAIHDDRDGLDN